MSLLILGLNYATANVELREKIAFATENDKYLGITLLRKKISSLKGGVIVSTCNRTEFYLDIADYAKNKINELIDFIIEFHSTKNLTKEELKAHLYIRKDLQAVEHIFKVSSGLDSLLVGDGQILGQVKDDYRVYLKNCQNNHIALSGLLNRLFETAFKVAKYIRTNTSIGEHTTSVAYAACLLTREYFTSLTELQTMVVGAGKMGELILRYLTKHNPPNIILANRTLSHADKIKSSLGNNSNITTIRLDEISTYIKLINIVFTATSSREVIFTLQSLQKIQQERQYKTLLLIDTSVPQNIDSRVSNIKGVIHYNIDTLSRIIADNKYKRLEATEEALEYIQREAQAFLKSINTKNNSHIIEEYRKTATFIKDTLLLETVQKINSGADMERTLEIMMHKLTNQLIHTPTTWIQHFAKNKEDITYLINSLHKK